MRSLTVVGCQWDLYYNPVSNMLKHFKYKAKSFSYENYFIKLKHAHGPTIYGILTTSSSLTTCTVVYFRTGAIWILHNWFLVLNSRPNLIDMNKVYRQTNLENLEQAFSTAERDMGVTRLLDPEGKAIRIVVCYFVIPADLCIVYVLCTSNVRSDGCSCRCGRAPPRWKVHHHVRLLHVWCYAQSSWCSWWNQGQCE